jgi:uncharacterized protein
VAVILRAAARTAVPWKNGGGLTREVAVHPPGSDLGGFDWRVSLAEVRAGGPFSMFPGIDRQLAVISGRLALSIAGEDSVVLSPASAPCAFAGELPAAAEPLESPVSDLNVMTRRGRFVARLRRCRGSGGTALTLQADTTLLMALVPLALRSASWAGTLSALDAVRLAAQRHAPLALAIESSAADYWLIEIEPVVV